MACKRSSGRLRYSPPPKKVFNNKIGGLIFLTNLCFTYILFILAVWTNTILVKPKIFQIVYIVTLIQGVNLLKRQKIGYWNIPKYLRQDLPQWKEKRRLKKWRVENILRVWLAQLVRASRCIGKVIGSTPILSTTKKGLQ